ncbi:MAG TPA: DUF1294 domain-containing protein [Opitutaceae bacterium]|nr:DUF1294 domain-containing protein [Opitutaceae bacterium]
MKDPKTDSKSQSPDAAGRLRPGHFVVLLLLVLPSGLALHRLAAVIDYRWLLAYAIVISLVTYAVYGADKDSAADRASRWRASERLLHGLELAGGWPGAFLAQRRFRHKTAKLSYQVVFWLIVALHVAVATDYVRDWSVTRAVWHRVTQSARADEPPASETRADGSAA